MKRYFQFFILGLLLIFLGISCNRQVEMKDTRQVTKAVAVLHPTDSHEVYGVITFEKVNEGIRITGDVEGLLPGPHGFHIHQYGDCMGTDGSAAGGHFNPEGKRHGSRMSEERHVGDLGNIMAAEDGNAHIDMVDQLITLEGSHSIIGRSVVVHAGEDDLKSQPSGSAGARLACGVIGIAEE
jgi:Cu-Zn family superoxide dismutase